MAEFIVGNPLRKVARKHTLLRNLLWRVDFVLIWVLVKLARLMPVDTASRTIARIPPRRVGGSTPRDASWALPV